MADVIDIDEIKGQLRSFVEERDWQKYQNPKNLSMAVASEAGELLEIFRWMSEKKASTISTDESIKRKIGEELSDIILNCINLSGILNINLHEAMQKKIITIKEKYPVNLVKGSSKKYTEY